MPEDGPSTEEWTEYLFDHEVRFPPWHDDDDAPFFHVTPSCTARLIAETFERADPLLAVYDDPQLGQGLRYLIDVGHIGSALFHESVEAPLLRRVLESFVRLFETAMAARCTPHLSSIDEAGAGPLNSICYMWWDAMDYYGTPGGPRGRTRDRVALSSMERILAIPHDACRESALHGLGHVQSNYPTEVASIIDAWLSSTPDARDLLREYAVSARRGMVL